MSAFKIVSCLSVLILGYSIAANGGSFSIPANDNGSKIEGSANWDFSIFDLNNQTGNEAMGHLFYGLLKEYGLLEKFQIPLQPLFMYLHCLKNGYNRYNVTYHSDLHGTDVLQTVHSIISKTGIKNWMSDLEILAILFAAVIHDNEHMGYTNDFLINSESERALIYNDQSVNENHHLYASFKLLRVDGCNFLSTLTPESFRTLRKLVIEMVLYTDMAKHFEILNKVSGGLTKIEDQDERAIVLSFILHCADISNPSKPWKLHEKWISLLLMEMYAQGDEEKRLGLEVCFMCDRKVNVADIQISFIDNFVAPAFRALGVLMKDILASDIPEPWNEYLEENRKYWKRIANEDD